MGGLESRIRGYERILKNMSMYQCLTFSFKEGAFLKNYYHTWSLLDRYMEHDKPLPGEYNSIIDLPLDIINFNNDLSNRGLTNKQNTDEANNPIKRSLLESYNIAQSFNQTFFSETDSIARSKLFDARRKVAFLYSGQHQIFSDAILTENFRMHDIEGALMVSLKAFKRNPSRFYLLEHIANATRIYHNLRDFAVDITAGYYNIPKEFNNDKNISNADIRSLYDLCWNFVQETESIRTDYEKTSGFFKTIHKREYQSARQIENLNFIRNLPSKFKRWFETQATNGVLALKKHEENIDNNEFSRVTRSMIHHTFVKPALFYFSDTYYSLNSSSPRRSWRT